jgi:cytidylate kinase
MSFQIAIDGPVAAGKGTVARLVASRLGFLYVDTGAMYRSAALIATRNGVSLEDEAAVAKLIASSELILRNPNDAENDGRQITVILDGEDISLAIRTEEMSKGSSIVSQFAQVRAELVKKQQLIAEKTSVVMEGRDITFRVLPEAQLKIYLDASTETRAQRRHQELLMRGVDATFESVHADLLERDKLDMGRIIDPLHITDDAWVLDTTNLTIEEVVEVIVQKVEELGYGKA